MVHYILDGYNIINRLPGLSQGTLEERRNALIQILHSKQGSARNSVTVVFDGQSEIGGWGPSQQSLGGFKVIFTSNETADDRIKLLVEEQTNRKNVVVISDDRDIQYYVRALGAQVQGVTQFFAAAVSSGRRVSGGGKAPKEQKNISLTLEHKINAELSDLWLNRKGKKKPA